MLCSGTCETGGLFKGVCPGTVFLPQQFADISIADLTVAALLMAWVQIWSILYSFIVWYSASVFLGIQAAEAKAEWNFMKLSRLI